MVKQRTFPKKGFKGGRPLGELVTPTPSHTPPHHPLVIFPPVPSLPQNPQTGEEGCPQTSS